MARKKRKSKKNEHNHQEGDICYECGFGIKRVSWKCIVGCVVLGVAFGLYLLRGNITQAQIVSYLTLVLVAVTLGLLLDTRKIILNHCFGK